MSRTGRRAAIGLACRALIAYGLVVFFWRALLSLALVVAAVLGVLAAAVAVAVGVAVVARGLLLRRRGW